MQIFNIHDRHKLFWAKPDLEAISEVLGHKEVPIIDVGKVLAEFLKNREIDKYISFDVEDYIKATVTGSAVDIPHGIKAVIIQNPGILLESDLKLKPESILLDLSKEIVIVIIWDYLVEQNKKLIWDNNTTGFDFPANTIKRLELL